MNWRGRVWMWRSLALLPWMVAPSLGFQTAPRVEFAREIAPLLKSKCVSCHGPNVASGRLKLDSIAGIRQGGISGSLFTPGNGTDSLLLQRLEGHGGKPRMPLGFAPLTDAQVQTIRRWIDEGARFGAPTRGSHWAYRTPKRPKLPKVRRDGWGHNPIDRFVLARLEREGLNPSPEAPRETLARRAALDLTGLPPSVEELDRFLKDARAGAYERYVDRLLASPHYGEKMARSWLDLARYADTNGYEKDLPRSMWPWRNWVIDAFNANMPYDRFTVEQLAGDLLPHPLKAQLVATGFQRNSMLNDEGGIDPEEFRVVAVVDRVDAAATTWLGSTLACAQCHDHKYDPFTQKDYYRFFAFFNQSEDNGRDTAPMLRLLNSDQQRIDLELESRIKKSESLLRSLPKRQSLGQSEWERLEREGWVTPTPEASAEEARLSSLGDGSVLASGPDAPSEVYRVALPLTGTVRGLRLQVIPDESLPMGSSGRNPNGSFVLGKVEFGILHADGTRTPVQPVHAQADFSQPGHDPENLLSGVGNGWAVAAFEPEHRVIHTTVFELGREIRPGGGDRLVVELKHNKAFPHHNVGRFRLSLTSSQVLAQRVPLGSRALAILTSDSRANEEAKLLATAYVEGSGEKRRLERSIADLRARRDELAAKAPSVMIMRDMQKPRPNRILKRGDFRMPGDPVVPGPPGFLARGSYPANRLGLARWIVDPSNPLTARVEVNRLWEQCFGRGLVATPEDFGTQGEPPSHPELLDWMATELIERKWEVKAMLRLIVTSSTYRQSSRVSPLLLKRDPYNLLLARGARFRLDAEGVRDIALCASGRLSTKIGGPSVMPPQPPGIWENSFSFYDTKERWVDAEGPNRYRRGLYTYWRRTAPFPMALTFDLKSRDTCVAHRTRTNTPLQALNLLNDPIFLECAGALAEKMQRRGIAYGFRACTGRSPSAKEKQALERLLSASKRSYSRDGKAATDLVNVARDKDANLAPWIVVANAILNLDETVTRG